MIGVTIRVKQEAGEIGMDHKEAIRISYPESIRVISTHLSYFLGDDIAQPAQFNINFPMLIQHVVDFYVTIHAMHARALEVLSDNDRYDRQFCLYLRSFASGGEVFPIKSDDRQEMGLGRLDERIRSFVGDALEGIMPVVSCFNTLDIVTFAEARTQPKPPPILRLLSHNWIRTINALIDRAQCVVMLTFGKHGTTGVQVELAALDRLHQMRRTIFVFAEDDTKGRDQTAPYAYDAFNWPAWVPEVPHAFAQSLTRLAGDGHHRTVMLPPIDYPPCFVVDKGFSVSRFESGELSKSDYADLLPDTLAPNYFAFDEAYPAIMRRWLQIESDLESGHKLDFQATTNAMFDALHCFVLAATMEIYEPMARLLAVIAKAHYLMTGTTEIAVICAGGAREFARLAGEDELATYFGTMEAEFRKRAT